MRRVSLFLLVLALAAPAAVWAQGKPDFSGTWTLDPAKSDPPPQRGGGGGGGGGGGRGFGGGPQTIKQTATELAVTTEGRSGQQTMTYKLDGSESVNKVMGRGGEIEAKSKAHWDGLKLVIETTRDMGGNMVTTSETRTLSADQTEMTVEVTFGENKRKVVYTKGS